MKSARRFLLQTALLGTIGVAAAAVVAPAVRVVLFESLPFPEADRLVLLWETLDRDPSRTVITSLPTASSWREELNSVDVVAVARHFQSFFVDNGDDAIRVQGAFVSNEYLALTGARAAVGRLFNAEESVVGAPTRRVVVSHRYWMEQLGGSDQVLTGILRIDDEPYEVVGVMEEGYRDWADAFVDNVFWFPLPTAELKLGRSLDDRSLRRFRTFGRLAEGATVAEAAAEITALHERLSASYPESTGRFGATVESATTRLLGPASDVLRAVLLVAVLLLTLTVLNVSVLAVLQGSLRGGDAAIRRALGASRWGALVPQIRTLGLATVLSLAAGLAVAAGVRTVLFRNASDVLPQFTRLTFTATDAAVAVGVALLIFLAGSAALLLVHGREGTGFFGATKEQVATGLGHRSFSRSAFVFVSVAVSMSIVVPGLIVQRGFREAVEVDPGFRTEGYWSTSLQLPPEIQSTEDALQILDALTTAAESEPGWSDVVLWGPSLPGYTGGGRYFVDERSSGGTTADAIVSRYHQLSPGGLERLGVRLLQGRHLAETLNRDAAGEVVVSEALAAALWPGENAIGRGLKQFDETLDSPGAYRVVGVAENALMGGRMNAGGVAGRKDAYFSDRQHEANLQSRYLLFRQQNGASGGRAALARTIQSVNPRITFDPLELLEPQLAIESASLRLAFMILTMLSAWAILQTAAGIFVVVAFLAHAATRALAIQKALGADGPRVIWPLAASVGSVAGLATVSGVLVSASLRAMWTPPGIEWTLASPSLWLLSFTIAAVAVAIALLPPIARVARLSPLMLMR